MVGHINTISKQATTCTLITNLGEKKEVGGFNCFTYTRICIFKYFQVQALLLAAISPYLASLLSQVLFKKSEENAGANDIN